MAQHAAMHADLTEAVRPADLAACSSCGKDRGPGSGGWEEIQLCGKCHKEAPGLREVMQLKCVIVLAEIARQLWGSKGHKVARSLATWKRVGEVLQGGKQQLWWKVVLFCFVLFDLQLSVCLCWLLGTAAGTIPTRR